LALLATVNYRPTHKTGIQDKSEVNAPRPFCYTNNNGAGRAASNTVIVKLTTKKKELDTTLVSESKNKFKVITYYSSRIFFKT
jgi:hypothetical protein